MGFNVLVNAGETKLHQNTPPPELTSGSTFSWMPSGTFFYDSARFKNPAIRDRLRGKIIQEFQARGYEFVETGEDVSFQVGYTLILENSLDDTELQKLYQQMPYLESLQLDPDKYEQGILIIKAVDPQTRRHFWRNTIQDFVNLEMPADVRDKRLHEIIHIVLASFPESVE